MPTSYLFFLLTSSLFVFIHAFLRISYAIFFGVIYLWGFIAIPTGALSGAMNLESGWLRNILLLAIWPILEATMYIFMKFIMIDLSASALSGFGGSTIARFSAMHGIMGSICLLMTILSIASAYMALRLASNQEALSGILAPAVMGATYVHHQMSQRTQNMLNGLSPTLGGSRNRDNALNALSDINQHPAQAARSAIDVAKAMPKGLGNAVSNALKNSASGMIPPK